MRSLKEIQFHIDSIIEVLKGRLRILLNPRSVKCEGVILSLSHEFSKGMRVKLLTCGYERAEAQVLKSLDLSEITRVLELGSSIGYLSNYLCSHFPQIEQIVGIEANLKMLEIARKNASLNLNQINYYNYCVVPNTYDSTEVFFNISEDFWSSSVKPLDNSVKQITAPACKINDLLTRFSPQFLIIDIEGSEYEVLGDTVNLEGVVIILIEVHIAQKEDYSRLAELILRLDKMGLKYRLNKSSKNILVFKR